MADKKQNGGKRGVAVTTEEHNNKIGEMIARHVVQLSEHLTSVQIIGTKLDEDGKTMMFSYGSGDMYARVKTAEVWTQRVDDMFRGQTNE